MVLEATPALPPSLSGDDDDGLPNIYESELEEDEEIEEEPEESSEEESSEEESSDDEIDSIELTDSECEEDIKNCMSTINNYK